MYTKKKRTVLDILFKTPQDSARATLTAQTTASDIRSSKETLAQLRADLQTRKQDHELRKTYRPVIEDAIKAAHKAIKAQHDKLREASKAFTQGSPSPAFPDITFPFDELTTLEALRAALYDPKTPFPPEHLAEKWADFKASRAR